MTTTPTMDPRTAGAKALTDAEQERREQANLAGQWCRAAFPDLVDDRDHVCNWAVTAALRWRAAHPGVKADPAAVRALRERLIPAGQRLPHEPGYDPGEDAPPTA